MNPVIFFLLIAIFTAPLSAEVNTNALGPVRSCRCYLSNVNHNIQAHTFSSVKSLGPAEICHCAPSAKTATYPIEATMPAPVALPMTAPNTATGPMHAASLPKSFFSSSRLSPCSLGPDVVGKYTVDDTSKLFMCGGLLSHGSLNQLINIDMKSSHYACSDFFFELRNDVLSSGLAFGIEVSGTKYVAVGSNSPDLPVGYLPLKAYAVWTYGSCENVNPTSQAVYVSTLDGTNNAFKAMVKEFGAFPLGVQNGDVYPKGLQCIRIENPFCAFK